MYSRRSISIASCWNESIFIRSKKWVPIRRRRSIDVVELLLFLTLICGPFSRHASFAFLFIFFIPSFNVSINLSSFRCSFFLFRILTFHLFHVINRPLRRKKKKKKMSARKFIRYPIPRRRLISSYRYLLLLSNAKSLSARVLTNACVPSRAARPCYRARNCAALFSVAFLFFLFKPNAPRPHRVTRNNRRSKYGHQPLYRY